MILKIFQLETFLLLIFILTIWLMANYYSINANYSKYKYYVNSDEEFINFFETNSNQSIVAFKKMKQWLKHNYKKALIPYSNYSIFNNFELVQRRKILEPNKFDTLCVGILSKRRPTSDRNYPLETVTSILTRIQLKYQDRVLINIFNVDNLNKQQRPEFINFDNIVNIIELKQNISDSIYKYSNPKVKEAADFSTITKYYNENRKECDLVALIEDDAQPCLNWYEKIIEAVQTIQNTNWYCLKLFTGFRPYDWMIHPISVLNAIFFIILFSFLALNIFKFILLLITKYLINNNYSTKLTRSNVYFLVVNIGLIIIWLKSTSVNPLGYGVKKFSIGFNNVANVYPRSKLNLVSKFLENDLLNYFASNNKKQFEPKDISINRFRRTNDFDEFVLEPSVFQHTGIHSSLGGFYGYYNIKNIQDQPFQSYSFLKEYYQPIKFDSNFWTS